VRVLNNVLRSRGRSVMMTHVRSCLLFDRESEAFLSAVLAPLADNPLLVDVPLSLKMLSQFVANN
jgi:hypothetical protein